MSEFAEDLPNRRRSKMDKIAVNAFIHGRAISDPIELNPNSKQHEPYTTSKGGVTNGNKL